MRWRCSRVAGLWLAILVSAAAALAAVPDRAAAVGLPPFGFIPLRLDASFGHGGVVSPGVVTGWSSRATSVAELSGGRIVAGGFSRPAFASSGFPVTAFVTELRPGGRPVTTFGKGGIVRLPGMEPMVAPPVTGEGTPEPGGVQPNLGIRVVPAGGGRLLVLGQTLRALTRDGASDRSFGDEGTAGLPAGFDPTDLAVTAAHAIVVLGSIATDDRVAGAVVQLTPNGDLDENFGEGGIVVLPQALSIPEYSLSPSAPMGVMAAMGVATLEDGSMVIGELGQPPASGSQTVLVHLLAAGQVDAAYGQGGQEVLPLGAYAPATLTTSASNAGLPVMAVMVCGGGTGTGGCFPAVVPIDATGRPEALPADAYGILGGDLNQIGALAATGNGWLVSAEGNPQGFRPMPLAPDLWREVQITRFNPDGDVSHTWAIPENRRSGGLLRETKTGLPDGTTTGAQTLPEPDGKILIVGSSPHGALRSALIAQTQPLTSRPDGRVARQPQRTGRPHGY